MTDDPRLTEARAAYESLRLSTDPAAVAHCKRIGDALVAHHNAECAMRRALGDAGEALVAWKTATVPLAPMPPDTFDGTPREQLAAAEAGLDAAWPLFEADTERNAEAARSWLAAVAHMCAQHGLPLPLAAGKRVVQFVALVGA